MAIISSVLQAAGYKVGTYTSPHMHSLHERITVSGAPISPTQLDSLVEENKRSIEASVRAEAGAFSHFEALTALAFK